MHVLGNGSYRVGSSLHLPDLGCPSRPGSMRWAGRGAVWESCQSLLFRSQHTSVLARQRFVTSQQADAEGELTTVGDPKLAREALASCSTLRVVELRRAMLYRA